MHIVRCVAGHALVRQLHFMGRLHMALLASQLGMGPFTGKTRCGVVELPVRPTVRVVAGGAAIAQRTFVVVVGLVAGDALGGRPTIPAVRMALFAAHRSVQTHQREAGKVMVEANLVTPSRLPVASGAVTSHTASMDVIRLMAAEAFFGEFLSLGARRVAIVAGQLFVLAVQRVLVFGQMVVLHRLPAIRLVAGGAVVTEAAGMGVFCRVAAMAGFRQLRL